MRIDSHFLVVRGAHIEPVGEKDGRGVLNDARRLVYGGPTENLRKNERNQVDGETDVVRAVFYRRHHRERIQSGVLHARPVPLGAHLAVVQGPIRV